METKLRFADFQMRGYEPNQTFELAKMQFDWSIHDYITIYSSGVHVHTLESVLYRETISEELK